MALAFVSVDVCWKSPGISWHCECARVFVSAHEYPTPARQLRGELAQTLIELSSFVACPFTNSGVRVSRSKRRGVISFQHSFRLERILLMARGWQ